MPTQLSRLLRPPAPGRADPLVDRLKRKEPDAEREIARRYNRKITDPTRTIPDPKHPGNYDGYDPRHLAVLWTLADNAEALRALGRQLCLSVPNPPDYPALNDDLLARLWDLGRDGAALEQLWQRRGLLPVKILGPDTPENVVGFLCWQERKGAWDELMRRYALFDIQICADEDEGYAAAEAQLLERFRLSRVPHVCQGAREFAAVAAGKLLHLVPLWDYVAYPSIEHMLVKATHNELRDMARAGRRRAAISADELPEAADPARIVPGSDSELQDDLAHRLPVEERIIRKAQNGLELNETELDEAGRRNLASEGKTEPAEDILAAERARIARWLADNPSPTGDHLNKLFPWYKPTQFGKASRLARLRLLAEETDRYLDQLIAVAPAEVRPLRRDVRRAINELLQRTASGNRALKRGRPRPGPVACFQGLDEAVQRLLYLVGDRPLDRRRAETFARLRDTLTLFEEQFPVLVKLAACRWLTRVIPAAGELATWLDAGQQWLSSLHEEDRKTCRTFAEALAALPPPGPRVGALPLLLAWLQATQQPGPAEVRLALVDRVWWLSQGRDDLAEPADALAEYARAGKWLAAAETADQMLRRLGPAPGVAWSAECEFRAGLERLRARRRDLPARLEAARRLLAYLRENEAPVPARRLADWAARVEALDSAAEDEALYREINTLASMGPPALMLLALWLQPASESRFGERALKDLTALWSLTHDPWYTWPAEVPAAVAGLIAAARDGDWPRLADAATRTLRRGPDLSGVGRSAGEDFRTALQRLARRLGQRTRARRTST